MQENRNVYLFVRLQTAKSIPKYLVQRVAYESSTATFDIKILFLPVAHPALYCVEMESGSVKRALEQNHTFHSFDVEKLTKEVVSEISARTSKNFERQTLKEKKNFR